jgi:hypothetical protein
MINVSGLPEEASAQLHIRRLPESPEPAPLYSNHVQVNFTPEDFTMHLGWYAVPPLTEPPEGGIVEAPVEPVARVVLPAILIRNLIALLQRQVDAYEHSFGPIPPHPAKPPWLIQTEAEAGTTERE